MKIAIIIPAYNEEKRIGKTLNAYSIYFNELKNYRKLDYEIIVIINNTKDETEQIVKDYKRTNPNINYLNFERGGKGFAVVEGFKYALKGENDLIGFVDADMATLPEEFYKLIENINAYDGAIADRYLKNSEVFPKITFRRLVVGRAFNYFIRAVLFINYKDTQCGAKIFKKRALQEVIPRLNMSKWAFDVELLYQLKKLGYKIISVPTKWIDREYSKINFLRAGPWMALGVIRLRILNSPLNKFIKIYDKFLGSIKK